MVYSSSEGPIVKTLCGGGDAQFFFTWSTLTSWEFVLVQAMEEYIDVMLKNSALRILVCSRSNSLRQYLALMRGKVA